MYETTTQWAKIAGVAGVGAGVLLLIYREIIRKNIFPTLNSRHAAGILRLIIIFTFVVATVAIIGWLFVTINQSNKTAMLVKPSLQSSRRSLNKFHRI